MNILLLGATGFIGQSVAAQRPNWNWTLCSSDTFDLTDSNSVDSVNGDFDAIINCAGFFGGLPFNTRYQQDILIRNTLMLSTVDRLVRKLRPRKVITIGTGCVYPGTIQGKIDESMLDQGPYHPSVMYSGLVKRLQLDILKNLPAEIDWEYLVMSNIYGPNEHLDYEHGHVIGSLLTKFIQATQDINMVGTGSGVRDFFYVSDAAEAVCRFTELSAATKSITNISSGTGISIKELTNSIVATTQFQHNVVWGTDTTQDGVPVKVLDNTKMQHTIGAWDYVTLNQGLEKTYQYVIDKI